MAIVEIRLLPTDVVPRLDAIRRWLDARGIRPTKFTSTGSSNEAVIIVEFGSSDDAEEFARASSGNLVRS